MKYRNFILIVNVIFYFFIFFYFLQILLILKTLFKFYVTFSLFPYFIFLVKGGMGQKEAWGEILTLIVYIVALPFSFISKTYSSFIITYVCFLCICYPVTYKFFYSFFEIILVVVEYLILNDFFVTWVKRIFTLYLFFLFISFFMYYHYFSVFTESDLMKLISNPNYDASWAYGLIILFILSSCYLMGGFIFLLIVVGFFGLLDYILTFVRRYISLEEENVNPTLKEEKKEEG